MPAKVTTPELYKAPPDDMETCSECGSPNADIHYKKGKRFLVCMDCGNKELLD